MRIRIVEPDNTWITFEPKNYTISKYNTKFVTMKMGNNVRLIRGFKKCENHSEGTQLKKEDFLTQALRIKYKAIGATPEEPRKDVIKKLMKSKYPEMIRMFLEGKTKSGEYHGEYGRPIKSLSFRPKKDGDFRCIINFGDRKGEPKKI